MSQRSTGCLKYGCLGCGALFALLFGGGALLVAMSLASDVEIRPEERRVEQILPGTPVVDPAQPDGPDWVQPGETTSPLDRPLVELAVDLSYGEFVVEPGPAGRPVQIESEFDAARFSLETELTELEPDVHRYSIHFGSRGGLLGLMSRGGASSQNQANRIKIIVPRDQRLRLVGEVSTGESSFELGGLWLEDVHLDLAMGDHFVSFEEPTLGAMRSFEINGRMGEIELRRLGDASPETIDVSQRMGDMLLDLHGAWRHDATVDGTLRMGSLRFWEPDAAHFEVEKFTITMGEMNRRTGDLELPAGAPTVRLTASGRMGELRIEP